MTLNEIENNYAPAKEALLNWDHMMSGTQSLGAPRIRNSERAISLLQNTHVEFQTNSLYPKSQLFSGSFDFNKLSDYDRKDIGISSDQIDKLRKDIVNNT